MCVCICIAACLYMCLCACIYRSRPGMCVTFQSRPGMCVAFQTKNPTFTEHSKPSCVYAYLQQHAWNMRVCVCTYMCLCMHIYISMPGTCVCVCVRTCVCVRISIEAGLECACCLSKSITPPVYFHYVCTYTHTHILAYPCFRLLTLSLPVTG